MPKIPRKTSTVRPFFLVKQRTRALLLGGLGLIPAACQSPVARFIPAQTIKELQDPANHSTPDRENVAKEIKQETGKQSLALTALESWVKGIGLSGYSLASSPLLSSADVSMAGYSSKHGRFRSSILGAIGAVFEHKIPSYTSGLVDNDATKRVRRDNKELEEAKEEKQ